MLAQEQGWDFGQEIGINTPANAMSVLGPLVTTGSLGHGLTSHHYSLAHDQCPGPLGIFHW